MTVNLNTGQFYAPRPNDYMSKIAAVAPAPAGTPCPIWREFLHTGFAGDADLISYIQRVCGYCLTGLTREHVLFFLYGTGANGKSVFIKTVAGIMGDYAISAPMDTFVESKLERHPTELAMLRGARLVVAVETEAGRRWNESRIKALTGGDRISARYMRGDFFEFTPTFKIMIAGNHRPSLRNVDEAIRRRIHLIPFKVRIAPEDRDDRLAEKLEAEWPAILAWMTAGCLEWQRRGLAPPKAVTDATKEYLAAEDAVALWISECCTTAPDDKDTTAELFASWSAWAKRASEPAGSMKAFSQGLEGRNYRKARDGSTDRQGFAGIRVARKDMSEEWWNQ